MSDEQMDDWLDRPMDAEVHRYRKISASWLEESADSEEDDNKIHVIQEEPDEEDSAAREERQHISALWRETWCMQDSRDGSFVGDESNEVAPEATEDASPEKHVTKSHNELQREIALHAPHEHAQPFRLSCTKFKDVVPTSLCST
jgi:hypothetical protein